MDTPTTIEWTSVEPLQNSVMASERAFFEDIIKAVLDPDRTRQKWALKPTGCEATATTTSSLRPLVVRWADEQQTTTTMAKTITYFGYRHVPRNVPEGGGVGGGMASEDDSDSDAPAWMDKMEVVVEIHNRHIVIRAPSSQATFHYSVCNSVPELASKFFPRLWQGLLRRFDSPFGLAYGRKQAATADEWHIYVRFDPDLVRRRLEDFPASLQTFQPMLLGYSRNTPDRPSEQNIAVLVPLYPLSSKGVWSTAKADSLRDTLLLQRDNAAGPLLPELVNRRSELLEQQVSKVQYVDKRVQRPPPPRPHIHVHWLSNVDTRRQQVRSAAAAASSNSDLYAY